MCVTCGLFRVAAHEAEPRPLLLAVGEQVKEPHLRQLELEAVQVLETEDTGDAGQVNVSSANPAAERRPSVAMVTVYVTGGVKHSPVSQL